MIVLLGIVWLFGFLLLVSMRAALIVLVLLMYVAGVCVMLIWAFCSWLRMESRRPHRRRT